MLKTNPILEIWIDYWLFWIDILSGEVWSDIWFLLNWMEQNIKKFSNSTQLQSYSNTFDLKPISKFISPCQSHKWSHLIVWCTQDLVCLCHFQCKTPCSLVLRQTSHKCCHTFGSKAHLVLLPEIFFLWKLMILQLNSKFG